MLVTSRAWKKVKVRLASTAEGTGQTQSNSPPSKKQKSAPTARVGGEEQQKKQLGFYKSNWGFTEEY